MGTNDCPQPRCSHTTMHNSQLENFTTLPLVVETEASSDICWQMFCVFNKLNSYTDISFFFFSDLLAQHKFLWRTWSVVNWNLFQWGACPWLMKNNSLQGWITSYTTITLYIIYTTITLYIIYYHYIYIYYIYHYIFMQTFPINISI